MFDGEANFPTAVNLGNPSKSEHFIGVQPTDRNVQTHVVQTVLLLREDADMVALVPLDFVFFGGRLQGLTEFFFNGGAEFVHAPLVNEPHHPGLLAVGARAEIAIHPQDGQTQVDDDLTGFDPGIHGYGGRATLGGEETTHEDVESENAIFICGDEGDIVNFCVD